MNKMVRARCVRGLRRVLLWQVGPVSDTSASTTPFGEGKGWKLLFSLFPSLRELLTPRGRAYIGECFAAVASLTALAGIVALFIGLGGGGWENAWLIVQIGFFGSIFAWLLTSILGWVPPPGSSKR